MTEFQVFKSPGEDLVRENQAFADANWDEHEDNELELLTNFFAKPDSVCQLFSDGHLVSSLVVSNRSLIYQGQSINFLGIGGVVTHKSFRLQGFASGLLKHTLSHFSQLDLALLSTDLDKHGHFYSSVGFRALQRPYYFLNREHIKTEDNGGMVAPLSRPDLVNLLLTTHDEINVGLSNF